MWENPNVQYVGDTNTIAQRRSLENVNYYTQFTHIQLIVN